MSTQPPQNVLPQDTRIGRTALRVTDLEEVSEFYRNVVGIRVLDQSDSSSVLGVEDTPLLVLEEDEEAPKRQRSSAGLFHNAFRVPSRAALGTALDRIRDRWQLSGASDHRVSEALYVRDPEGNGVEIYCDLPRDEWPTADDGRVQIGTEPLDLERIEAAAEGSTRAPPGTDVGHIHLEVSSLDGFRKFYIDTLRFEVQTTVPAASFVSAGGYHHHIGANTWQHRTEPLSGRGLAWFEIVLPEPQALDALRERFSGSQYSLTEADEGVSVMDSDGIEVRLRVDS
ncbi:VOC family protein [Saliphagus infecundisoli]|uniref:VOC family protein n=1 Tax=Saliphagus infecundisoli TaxID=1849069 RepID=A0ABD5QJF1_9EURY|nr:VOC family protein [Saliphagus infecundisoli]